MEAESEKAFNYERHSDSDEEPEMDQSLQEMIYPQCIIDPDTNSVIENSNFIKLEPQNLESTDSCENGQFSNLYDEPEEKSSNGATLDDRNTNYTPFQCSECDLECPSLSSLEFHTKLHVMERLVQRSNYDPSDNGQDFNLFQNSNVETKMLNQHKPFHEKSYTHGDEARDFGTMMESLISQGASKEICSPEISYGFSGPDSVYSSERPYNCDVCGFRFKSTTHLKRHMQIHTGDKPYACSICDYRCARNDKLKIHMHSHNTGPKPFACTECDYSSVRKDKLKDHMKTHITGQKQYASTNFAFEVANISSNGATKPDGEREINYESVIPKIENTCDERVTQSDSIMESLISQGASKETCSPEISNGISGPDSVYSSERPHKCDECGFRFKSTTHLKRHMQTHTGEKPYACSICDYRCARNDKLKIHLQSHNTEQKQYAITDFAFGVDKTFSNGSINPGEERETTYELDNLKVEDACHERLTHWATPTTGYIDMEKLKQILKSKAFHCPMCDYQCSSTSILKLHMVKHSDERPFKCEECDSRFKARNNLQAHMLIHLSTNCFKCTHCEYTCSRKAQFNRHMLTHTGTKRHACPLCDYRCNESGNLAKHMVIHGDYKPFSCPEEGCDYKCKLKCNLKTHMLKHSGERPYMCHLCDYRSITKGSLNSHMFKHSGEKPFLCSVCGNRYAVKGDLNVHMRIHTNDKKFKCEQCDYRCFTQQRVDEHMLIHTGEKPHKCDECGFKFSTISHLKRHKRTHTGDKPYACTECDYKCARNDKLKIHMQAHMTGKKRYACTECDYSTGRNDKLKDHIQTHNTGEKLYACKECDYSTSRNDYLKSHMKKHVPGNLELPEQSKTANDLTNNETINSSTKSNCISQTTNGDSSNTDTITGNNPMGTHGIFGSVSAESSQSPNDSQHHSDVSNASDQAHQTHYQENKQPPNNQHITGINNLLNCSSQGTKHVVVNDKMYSNNMEYNSLSKEYNHFPPPVKPLWHQGSSSIPAVNTDGYNHQVLSDKLLYASKLNSHTGGNLAHVYQNYSHNPLVSYPQPTIIDSPDLTHLNYKNPSSMPVPPNTSEIIQHTNYMYNIQ